MRQIYTAICFLALCSCKPAPVCVLEEEQMVRVFSDIQLAEVAVQNLGGSVKDSVLNAYYEQIFAIHEVEREQFEACFEYFQQDPGRLGPVFEKTLEELNRQRAQIKPDSSGQD